MDQRNVFWKHILIYETIFYWFIKFIEFRKETVPVTPNYASVYLRLGFFLNEV